MGYNSIIRKPCKCGCGRPPSIGFAGYNSQCRPDLVKKKLDKQSTKQTQALLRKNANNSNKLIPNQAKIDYEKKEQWFTIVRRKLTGTCQCGCGNPSSKNDDKYYRHSCAHIFPKNRFKSIQFHPENYVERAFWGGCHSKMDDTSIEKWKTFADWEAIVEKFHLLAPLLTNEERANKFYTILEKLIYA